MRIRAAALAAALACNPPASVEPAPAPPVEAAPPEPTCEEPPPGALALLTTSRPANNMPDRTCPWVLYEQTGAEAGELALRPLGRGEAAPVVRAPLAVIPPEDCQPCNYTGVVTAAGPVLLATRPSADSELADAAWLGSAIPPPSDSEPDPEPITVTFTSLWFGQPVFGDSTFQGPSWALAPHLCEDRLVLVPEPRLPGAASEEPPRALVEAAGTYVAVGAALQRHDLPAPYKIKNIISQCTRVALELP